MGTFKILRTKPSVGLFLPKSSLNSASLGKYAVLLFLWQSVNQVSSVPYFPPEDGSLEECSALRSKAKLGAHFFSASLHIQNDIGFDNAL